MENQLKGLSVDQLQAKIYDSLVVVENHQEFIKILNNELRLRSVKPTETAATEAQAIVNKIINETDENNKEN
jgi:hypothetical protein